MEPAAPTYLGKIHPPYSGNTSLLQANRASAKAGKIFYAVLGALFIGGIVWLILMLFFWRWSFYVAAAVSLFLLIAAIRKMLKSQFAPCPCCGAEVGAKSLTQLLPDDKNLQFACERCFEWLISDRGKIREFRETDVGERKEFDCRIVANGIWPEECILCGAAPTRRLNARTFDVGLGSLLVGGLAVSYGSVKNIPYCDTHKDAVSLKNSDNKLWVVFGDYSARRRYLYVNKRLPMPEQ